MARLGSQFTLVYHLFVVFTFFGSPFFANTAAPVVFVSAREVHREQALARAQQRWDQRILHPGISNIDPELALPGPSDPHIRWRLSPTPTHKESHRFANPSQTSVPNRTKSAPLNRITSSPGESDDLSPLQRRYIEKRAVCPIAIQTTVILYFSSGAQFPFSTSTIAGPRSTGIPGDDINGLPNTNANAGPVPTNKPTNGEEKDNGPGGPGPKGPDSALLAGIFSILALIILAFVLTVWYHCRNRKTRKLVAPENVEERKDGPTVVREMGSKGFASLRSSTPPSQNRGSFHPGDMINRALTAWGRPRNNQDSRHSKASEDSELHEWNTKSRRSVRWTELPPGSMRRESDFTGTQSDEMYPAMVRDRMGAAHVEEYSVPLPIPASPSLDFQFPQHHARALSVSDSSHSPSVANPAFIIPRVPVRYEANILYATSPEVLYGTGASRSESPASSYAVPPTRVLPIDERPHSNFTGATSASRSISPRRATTTTATTSLPPSIFKRTSDAPSRSLSPPLEVSSEGALSPSARMTGFGLNPASQLEARTVGGAGQELGMRSSTAEDLSAPSGYGADTRFNPVLGQSGSSSMPFPRESLQVLPVHRPLRRDEMTISERQAREKERKMMSRRIVQLAMASPGALVSQESFSTVFSQGMPDMYEAVPPRSLGVPTNEGSYPPMSIRPEHLRDDSTKSYPYAGLIALHAPTARPLSASSKAKSPISLGRLSLGAETDFGGQSEQASRAASFSSSQYLYGYPTANVDGESARGRSLRSSRRSSMSALSTDPTSSPWRQRNPSLGPSGRAGARASFGPTNKAEAAQRAAALIQLTSGVRRDRRQQLPTASPTPLP